jgi:peptidyl-dipeptidase Dcp
MRGQIEEIEAIANQSSPATFDNTIIPMERSGGLLTRVSKAFNAVTGANTDSRFNAFRNRKLPSSLPTATQSS